MSWKALGKPKAFSITFGCNFREDPELAKDFLMVAGQVGANADSMLRGSKGLIEMVEGCKT